MKKNGKYCSSKKSLNMKPLALLLALTLLLGCAIGGTIAWLTANTGPVQNTFSASDISIELQEHTYDPNTDELTETETETGVNNYKMVPGWTIPKDPWITVSADSEDCYLFVKVEKQNNFDTYMSYAIDENWIPLVDANNDGIADNGVYYKIIDTDTERFTTGDNGTKTLVKHSILAGGTYTHDNVPYTWNDNQVLTKPEITKQQMNAIGNNKPALKFTAYAVQLWKQNKSADNMSTDDVNEAQFTPAEAWNLAKDLGNQSTNP